MPDSTTQPGPDARQLLCPRCGYNVGPTADWTEGRFSNCPECGERFVADLLARKPKPKPISSEMVVWHLFWPAIIVFFASLIPVLSLITMPIAVLTLMITNAITCVSITNRILYHSKHNTGKLGGGRQVGYAIAIWFGQAVLMAFTAFGGCAIAVNNLSFH